MLPCADSAALKLSSTPLSADQPDALKLVAATTGDLIALLDPDGRITWISTALPQLGIVPESLLGHSLVELIAPDDALTFPALMADAAATGPAGRSLRMLAADGESRWMALTLRPLKPGQPAAGWLSCWRDIGEEVELRSQQEQALRTDPLSGLANRRETFRQLEQLTRISGAELPPPPLALAFCELDWFKRVNDSHGHAAGDALLAAVGERLRRVQRPDDRVGRSGGDELLVANTSLQVTASIGVTLFQPGESVDVLVARADAAIYRAKQDCRDRVIPISL